MSPSPRITAIPPAEPAAPDLTQFDALVQTVLDPAVRTANIAAIREIDAELADAIARTTLPDHWRPARGLDGAATFRIERDGEPPAWLSGTAAPDVRARGQLDTYDPLGKCPVLPCAGTGGEIRHLLDRLPPHLTLYIAEQDLASLDAVIQLVDVADAIRSFRLVIVPPGREARFLGGLLDREPGLLPPGTILTPTLVDRDRLEEIRRLCERMLAETALARQRQILAVEQAEARREVAPGANLRLALVSLTLDPSAHARLERVRSAAEAAGLPASASLLRGPRDASPLATTLRLAAFQPTLSIWVGHEPSVLPTLPRGAHAIWVQRRSEARPSSTPNVRYLAASPTIDAALVASGVSEALITPLYWATSGTVSAPEPEAGAARAASVILVGDLPHLNAESLGLTLDSQRTLWECTRRVVREGWETELVRWPERVLQAAERLARYSIGDAALREHFLDLTASVAIPGESLLQVAGVLRDRGHDVRVIGAGWRASEAYSAAVIAERETDAWLDALHRVHRQPIGFVFAGSADVLTPSLVEFSASGLPVALHAPGGTRLDGALGGVLLPVRDLHIFATRKQLAEGVESFGKPAAAQRAARVRAHLLAHHSWLDRVRQLEALVEPTE